MAAIDSSRRNFIKKATMAGIAVTGFAGIEALAVNDDKEAIKNDHLNF